MGDQAGSSITVTLQIDIVVSDPAFLSADEELK